MTNKQINLKNHFLVAMAIALGALIGSDVSAGELILFEQVEGAPRLASRWLQARAVSADGEIIALHASSFPSGDTNAAWTWTRSNGFGESVSDVGHPVDISMNGDVVLLIDHVWDRVAGELTAIDGCVQAISADAKVAAGSDCFGEAAIWTPSNGLQSLGIAPALWESQIVRGMSADGSIVVGGVGHSRILAEQGKYWAESDGFIWRDGKLIELGLEYDGSSFTSSPARAFDVSADGNVVLAHSQQEFHHYSSDGELIGSLGPLDGMGDFDDFDGAFLSSDGLAVIGSVKDSDVDFSQDGFIWDSARGYRSLTSALELEHSISFPDDTRFIRPLAISDDKRAIVGYRKRASNLPILAWAAYLDRPIDWVMGDADHDNDVDFGDFLALSDGFGAADEWEQGDFDHSGIVDFADFLLLSNAFGFEPKAVVATAVPEPSTLLPVLLATLAILLFQRNRLVVE